jgi:acyl carrier protein
LPGPTHPGPMLHKSGAVDAAEVLEVVRSLITEVIGEDYLEDIDMSRDTSFRDDLDVESIEFVALGEALVERYGNQVDFAAWIATMDVDEIIGLTVGQLVDHIVECHG